MNCEYRRGNDTDASLHKVIAKRNQIQIGLKRATQYCILITDIATDKIYFSLKYILTSYK
jgi:hypothetical protein